MEYVYYILITLGVIAVSLFLLRMPGQSRLKGSSQELSRKAENLTTKRQKASGTNQIGRKEAQKVLKRELSNVPTPWGWPGHDAATAYRRNGKLDVHEVHGVGESMHQWVDKLLREKQSVEDRDYREKRAASLRALLEDRYGNASKLAEIRYKKVRAPRLRDPQQPHDQMDNFPSGKSDRIETHLKRQPKPASPLAQPAEHRKKVVLQSVKKPWGW